MSDDWLFLVPMDPEWTPAPEVADRCVEMLKGFFPQADEVTARFEATVILFDAGCLLESIACSACEQDVQSWWKDAMNEAWKARFSDLSLTAPCCGARTSLNDLHYHRPMAFGRFALEVFNPGSLGLSQEQHDAIERCLGKRLRTVWRHL